MKDDEQKRQEEHDALELDTEFHDEKDGMKDDEQKRQEEHDALVLDRELSIETAQSNLKTAEENRATTTKEIATTQQDLTLTLAQLHDDQAYIKDLTNLCEEKAKEWDQRSTMRQDELSALTQALAIIAGKVTDKTSDKTIRFVEHKA